VANAFYVHASSAALRSEWIRSGCPKLLGWARLEGGDKLLPGVLQRIAGGEGEIGLRAELFPGADPKAIAAALRQPLAAQRAAVRSAGAGWIELRGPATRQFVDSVAALQEVYALDLARAPLKPCDLASANADTVTACQQAPFNLSGNGITVMVRDQ